MLEPLGGPGVANAACIVRVHGIAVPGATECWAVLTGDLGYSLSG